MKAVLLWINFSYIQCISLIFSSNFESTTIIKWIKNQQTTYVHAYLEFLYFEIFIIGETFDSLIINQSINHCDYKYAYLKKNVTTIK